MIPVLAIIFNRPEKTQKLMDALAQVRPAQLFISADGPRNGHPTDAARCAEARRIAQAVTWPCEVRTNFSDINLGCKIGVSSAISWFFSQVDRGVILEDDCIPSPAFFSFAEAMLDRYADDRRVMHVGGTTFLDKRELSDPSAPYHFSKVTHIWGWATWKRAWDLYDIDMEDIEGLESRLLADKAFTKPLHARFWTSLFRHVRDKKIDTWDSQWVYTVLSNDGLSIMPSENLVENIGFDGEATHTRTGNPLARAASLAPFDPNTHAPQTVEADKAADARLMDKAFVRSPWQRLVARVFGLFR